VARLARRLDHLALGALAGGELLAGILFARLGSAVGLVLRLAATAAGQRERGREQLRS
jgi:hypothetical protein